MNAVKFSGTTAACLLAYGQTLPKGRQAAIGRKPMADFINVTEDTVYRWLNGAQQPIGFGLIKVWYWLESQGYIVTDLQQLKISKPVIYALGYFLSFGKFELDALRLTLTYHKLSSFLAVLRGETNASAVKQEQMRVLMQTADRSLYDSLLGIQVAAPEVENVDLLPQLNAPVSRCIVELIEALLPLLERAISDVFSDEERRQLRKAVPQDGLYRLSRLTTGLCSRESRRIIKEEGKS